VSYLKAHFPAEFTAALISNQGGFYGPGAYLEEARRWGVEVLPPCVNSSEEECTGRTVAVDPWGLIESFLRPPSAPEPLTDPRIPSVRPPIGWVRIGLNLVSGLRAGTALRIATERHQGGEYRGLEDFLRRSAVLPEEVHRLVDAGALDGLVDWQRQQHPGALRPRLHLEAERLLRRLAGEAGHGDLLSGLGCDGGEVSGLAGRVGTPGGGPPWSMLETCQREAAVLGFMVGAHPLDFITVLPPPRRAGIPLVPGRLIRQFAGRRVRMMGWLVAAKLLNTKTTGAPMKMLTLEDRTDTFEATLFPRVYERYAPRTLTRGPYLVEGTVDVSLGSPVLTVSHLEVLPLCEPEVGVD
jgi:DNA polymerase III alpha subunit